GKSVSRKSRRQKKSPNRFILYRTYHLKHSQCLNNSKTPMDMRTVSKVISAQWANEPPDIKRYWDKIAENEKTKRITISKSSDPFLPLTVPLSDESKLPGENSMSPDSSME
ncbi:16031_t:CDS:2, partial [Racocetra persica]